VTIDRRDPELRRWLLTAKAGTWSEMEALCLARFGAGRAWPAALLADVYFELFPPRRGYKSAYQADREVMQFIAQRAGLLPGDTILRAGISVFGKARFPSRTHLYRLIPKIQTETHRSAIQAEMGHPSVERPQ
jgi:hypothetical protein